MFKDIVALVVQAIGGAKASIAVENDRSAESGGHIMLAGIAIQMGMFNFRWKDILTSLSEYSCDNYLRRPR